MASDQETLVDRLRGIYRVPITDGLGAVGSGSGPDNPNEFAREFSVPSIQREAADEIERLRDALQAAAAIPPSGEPVAWMHRLGAIWRADNCPSDIDFLQDGWTPLFAIDEAMVEGLHNASKIASFMQVNAIYTADRDNYRRINEGILPILAALNPQPMEVRDGQA